MLIWINADSDVVYEGFRKASDGTYLNAATATFVVKDANDIQVIPPTGELTMDYVAGSDGDYRGTIDKAEVATFTQDAKYFVEITIAEGDVDDFRRLEAYAQYRTTE